MPTTTVRLEGDDEQRLRRLALTYGSRSAAIREGLRLLDERDSKHRELSRFVDELHAEFGPPDPEELAADAAYYFGDR